MDLSGMTLVELRKLNTKVQNEIGKRQDSTRKTLLKRMQKMAAEEGLDISDVLPTAPLKKPAAAAKKAPSVRSKKTVKAAIAPKYRSPADASITWSGRGRKPEWFKEWIDAGKAADELLIQG